MTNVFRRTINTPITIHPLLNRSKLGNGHISIGENMIVDQERIVITQPIVNPWLTNRKSGVRLVSSTIIHHAVVLKQLHSGGVVLTGRPN